MGPKVITDKRSGDTLNELLEAAQFELLESLAGARPDIYENALAANNLAIHPW
jgi:hypothetical protein